MKRILLVCISLVLVTVGVSNAQKDASGGQKSASSSQKGASSMQMTKDQMQRMYVSYLKQEGYVPSVDEDGDVQFKIEGGTYYIIINEDDQQYFRILFPNMWSIDDNDEFMKVVLVAMNVTGSSKLARVYVTANGKNTNIEASTLLKEPKEFKVHFARMLRAIAYAKNEFVMGMRK